MRTPLYDAVQGYIQKDMARFHMPGHKGRGEGFLAPVLPWDITEVAGADSLYEASGALLELEEMFARLYESRRTLLSAGGATLCIQTMLALACGQGKTLIMGRGAHRAAVNTAALLDLKPVWLYPDDSAGPWFSGRYAPEALEELLRATPDAVAVYITSPDYFGVMSDIPALAEVCRRHALPLLVDNAHGAHLRFLPGAPHPVLQGASMCCDSLHKSMPAMTGGALLHIADSRYVSDAKRVMSLFGSSSPSYPIMLSCEYAASWAQSCEGQLAEVTRAVEGLRRIALQRGFALPLGPADPLKLSFCFTSAGLDWESFAGQLRECGIEPEYTSKTACVCMASGGNDASDFERLECALWKMLLPEKRLTKAASFNWPRPPVSLSLREAVFSKRRTLALEEAIGRVAADVVAPCPPGIPLIMAGELIDKETVRVLADFGVREVDVCI